MSAPVAPSVCVLYPSMGPFDAIAQHASGLVSEIERRGMAARYAGGGARALIRRALARDCDWILVEYMPYSYGRWGAAPGLVAAAVLARLVPRGPRLALMVHETPDASEGWRAWLMSTWQWWQLRALAQLAERTFASTESNRDLVRAMAPRHQVVHLPVPSNVPRCALDRDAARRRIGIAPDELVVAVFGGRHPSRALGHIRAGVMAIAAERGTCTLLNVGGEAPCLMAAPGVRVIAPGPSSVEELSAQLAAADIYLAAFHDGASTRRTTLAAALAHGLAVVGTDGRQTGAVLRDSAGCILVAEDDLGAFAATCRRVAGDDEERARLGRAALDLYEALFSWHAVGDRFAAAIAGVGDSQDPPAVAAAPGRACSGARAGR